jgi:osmotically-inducible protein OsmY
MDTIGMPLRQMHHNTSSIDQDTNDQLIVDSVRVRLDASGYDALRKVEVLCYHGRVILQGRVVSYFLKQVAQTVVLSTIGECEIDNNLRVTH